MLDQQRGKPLYVPATKEEMLYYADWRYVEGTPWQQKLAAFLMKRMPKNWYLVERERALWEIFFDVRVDGDVHLLLGAAEEWGLVMKRDNEVEQFAALCVDYTNHARLFVNRGYTPAELSALMPRDLTQKQTAGIGPRMRAALANGTMTVEELREQFRTQEFPHESVRTAFLEELERVAAELGLSAGQKKVGHNDPCPCGSGKNIRSAADGELTIFSYRQEEHMDAAKMIDHTLLKTDATRAGIDQLLSEAKQYHFASVCVSPIWVAYAAA